MLSDRITIVTADLGAASELRDLIGRCSPFHELETIDGGEPESVETFLRSVRDAPPQILFVEVRGFVEIAAVLEPVKAADPFLPVVAFFRNIENNAFLELQRMGMPHLVQLPSTPGAISRILADAGRRRAPAQAVHGPESAAISFLPAKPGSGASTAAWHFANTCAAQLEQKVALVDLDINCGVQALFADVRSGATLFDAISVADHTGCLPPEHHIASAGLIHVFAPIRRCRSARIDSSLFLNFLSAVRRTYPLVIVDHSGNWERFSVEAMAASGLILCVAADDYISLTQAHMAIELFEESDLLTRSRLLLSRHASRWGADPAEAERLAGLPLCACLPNSYATLQKAIASRYLAHERSEYSGAVRALAARMLDELGLTDRSSPDDSQPAPSGPSAWLTALGLSHRQTAVLPRRRIMPRS